MGSNRPSNRGQKRAAKTAARRRRQTSGPTASTTERVLARFVTWMAAQEGAGDVEPTRRVVESLLGELTRVHEGFTPTAWTPDDAHLVLDAAESVLAQNTEASEDAALHLVFSALSYLTFLDDEDIWSGSDADYEHCMEDLTDFVDGVPDTLTPEDITLPEVTADAESAALAELAIVRDVDALLAWSSTGRPIDAKEVAAALGLTVPASTFQMPADVPELAHAWTTAVSSGVVEISDAGAAPGPLAANVRAREADALRTVVAAHVTAQLSADDEIDVSASVADSFVAQAVLAAMTPDPPEGNLDENYDDLEGEDKRTAELVTAKLRAFIDQGLLVGGEVLLVPPELRHAVLDGVGRADIFGTVAAETSAED
ncbi:MULTISPECIES: hypothetical protein [Nocardiaceae]|uniref:Uncharacterized protein n=1 Tax=Rhodococcoides corynebacterioides TaxID=53972 RepID=A0ABS2KVT8_9NOCA|nr:MULTISPECIES: hypothetical protein [Rhodococcus]MBM7415926.1 hypothetical protein [Rhodococcus corynebacterioides]MBP1118388.1 hypothetical protein [Rhodococcus sp. PvP016]